AKRFSTTIRQSVYMFNVFLMPKLELALHYVHGPHTTDWLGGLDRSIIGSITHSSSSPLRLSHTAVALAVGLRLPSWLEMCVKVSELFIRMNSLDARWGLLGRIVMRQSLPSTLNQSTVAKSPNSHSLIKRAAYLAVHHLGW